MSSSKTTQFRESNDLAQLNIHLDRDTKEQFARVCKARKIKQREAIERLVIGWITGSVQLP